MRTLYWLVSALLLASVSGASANPEAKSGYFTTSDGVRLHYLEAGSGPPIVFVPGWMNPAWIWEPQIRHFSKKYRVVALDPRSQGESEQVTEGHYPERRSQDIKELMDHLQLPPAVLVGFSMGVPEVLTYVSQFGTEKLRGVVLVDQPISQFLDIEQFVWFVKMLNTDRRQMFDQFLPIAFKQPQPEEYIEKVRAAALKIPANTAIALLAGYMGRDWRPVLEKLDKPVLYTITKSLESQGEMLKTRLPSARVELFPESGHVIFADETDRFNAILEDFVEDCFARRSTPR
ncbi:MAG: alpha/beta hydrolase [Acidobacteria bacterium]|nr:alpha/beta hydrolase [Acidobacteriota bacterium]